ncbi:S8 family serine peptidase [Nocardioides sp. HDW12B]|uniref:S8 family serine peptidase n=1 Tax=Nocardioides sp. HDW12B TaxID=2714939 RepID=UPI00140B56FE|nr:S8 family serine peptidase [Nocardioides sp. HDW12B]QIK66425.1 S8 family serine peptidase [Nocardioides sp. HDW12B]
MSNKVFRAISSHRGAVVAVTALALTGVACPALAEEVDATTATDVPTVAEAASSEGDAIVSTEWGDVTARQEDASTNAAGTWSASRDVSSMWSLTRSLGIQDAWSQGITGDDVTVAVIDTGIAPVRGLTTAPDQVVDGPDLSFDNHLEGSRYYDEFGHGTHMAGIVAGRDADWSATSPAPGQFAGVAPEAQLLNMKVGAGDGGVDVSQVIAALDWVVEHRDAGGMDVRVVSLAYGTVSLQPSQVDPLARAVENAWRAGIVVVASAGNDGLETDHLLMPALSPHILAVGAVDPRSTDDRADDVVADFTNGGNDERRPDVVAPGRSVVSLRVPGSYADVTSPEGRVEGDLSERYFRGSGTSQATAFVAGQVALLLQQRPDLTPDQVKTLLMSTARPLAGNEPAMGAGVPDVLAAVAAPAPGDAPTTDAPFSSGLGSLDAARGDARVVDPDSGTVLEGEQDAQGQPWDAAAWVAATASGGAWDGGTWNGRTWTGDELVAGAWEYAPWTGTSWSGATWEDRHTAESTWEARSWRNDGWEARSWREDSWEARSWREDSWEARSWRQDSWEARSWR